MDFDQSPYPFVLWYEDREGLVHDAGLPALTEGVS